MKRKRFIDRLRLAIALILCLVALASVATFLVIETKADPESDKAYGAINPSYHVSNSSLLYDDREWLPIVPPQPYEANETEDSAALEIYNVTTGEVVHIPSRNVVTISNSTPYYLGLLPPGTVQETVFPPDDRERVTPTTPYPWRTICKLYITAADDSYWSGSGAIIGCGTHGFFVLTAAHCVYMHDHGGWVKSIEVIPGFDDGYMPYHHAWVTHIWAYSPWVDSADHRYDISWVKLDRNIGDYTGWMGRLTTDSSHWIYSDAVNTAGYPGDKCSGRCMYFDADTGCGATEHNHWYKMDTYGGQSGSPVWCYDWPDPGERYILTVHAYGDDTSGCNHGTRLNQEKFDDIDYYCGTETPPTDYADLIDDGQAYSGFTPTKVAPDDSFSVWCRIRNVGTASSGGFYVSYYASKDTIISESDYLIGTDYVSSISPFSTSDSEWSGAFPYSIPGGTYWIGWIIDSEDYVAEFDETNNVAYKDSYQLYVEPFDFSVSCSPSSRTVTAGDSTTYTITVTLTSGTTQTVSLSCSGCPSGASCTLSPSSGNPTFSSTLTVSTSTTTPQGTYTLTLTGTGGGKTRSCTVQLIVEAPFDFSVSCSPSSRTVTAGDSTTYTITVTLTSGTTQTVSLSCSGCPSGASCTLSPSSGNPTFSSTLTVSTSTTTPQGTYTLTLTGTGGGKTRSCTVQLIVEAPFDFSVSCSPSSRTVTAGDSTTYTITVTLTSGTTQTVSLSCSGCPPISTCSFSPPSGYPTFASTFAVQTSSTTPLATYTLTITGTGGGKIRSCTVTLTVQAPPFEFSVHLMSTEDTGGTANLGTITFDDTTYSLPNNVSKAAGTYGAQYNPASGHVFDHWETTGGISVSSPTSNLTTVTVSGNGTLNAIYREKIGWDVVLIATKEGYSDVSDFGVRSDATECFDLAYDELDPPEPPVGVVSYFWHPDCPTTPVDQRKLSTSKIGPADTMCWTYKVKPVAIDGLMCISWSLEEIAAIPSNYTVRLDSIDMREVSEYCFTAESDVTYTFTICVSLGCDFELYLYAGWNMVSFPCLPRDDPSFSNILSGVGYYRVLTWNGTSYIEPENATCGWGYWILVLEDTNVTITNGIPCESYERDLPPGWSMIGSICCTVDADSVFPGYYQLLTWDGKKYVPSDTIEPGKGYWALVLEETHIVVDESCCISGKKVCVIARNASDSLNAQLTPRTGKRHIPVSSKWLLEHPTCNPMVDP